MKKKLFLTFGAAVVLGAALYSCSGSGSGSAGTGTVGIYVTDDMSVYSQVTATIDGIQLVNTDAGTSCTVLSVPVSANIANLANIVQLADVAQCPAGPYNRFRVEFDKGVQLMSGPTGTASACSFTSYLSQGSGNTPDVLNCDPVTNICTLDVNGAVNVLAQRSNKVALDFDLKNFSVMNFGMPGCSVTMKVSPLTADGMLQHGSEAVTGLVSGISTTNMTFDLTRGTRTYSVLCSGITDSSQPDLSALLQRAQDDTLRTMVTTSSIDLANNSLTAKTVEVKAEGVISNLTGTTFTLNYGAGGNKTMVVDYSGAVVDGVLADGSWVDLKLVGLDGSSGDFVADKVEIESMGMTTDN